MHFSSLTRMPVEQIANIKNCSLSLALLCAAPSSRRYSGSESSRLSFRNALRCTRSSFTLQPGSPAKPK